VRVSSCVYCKVCVVITLTQATCLSMGVEIFAERRGGDSRWNYEVQKFFFTSLFICIL